MTTTPSETQRLLEQVQSASKPQKPVSSSFTYYGHAQEHLPASAMPPSPQRPEGILTEAEIQAAPLEPCHRDLTLTHFHRLTRTLAAADKDLVGRYTTRVSAREHLARLTLVIRAYTCSVPTRDVEDDDGTIESMIADVVDASLFVSGTQGTFSQPAFPNPLSPGREHEIAALMQELSASGASSSVDALELWDALPPASHPSSDTKILPDHEAAWPTGLGKPDWPQIFLRSRRSDDDLAYHTRDKTFTAREQAVIAMRLRTPLECRLRYHWPPAGDEDFLATRLRTPAEDTGSWGGGRSSSSAEGETPLSYRETPFSLSHREPLSPADLKVIRRKLRPLPSELNYSWPPAPEETPTGTPLFGTPAFGAPVGEAVPVGMMPPALDLGLAIVGEVGGE
ncbi:hypothetical protein LTR08_007982 [Meristemomyces frigidus]|nr:hypothetical protein LTR08_007982 [Meristemomyces frigidus]